MSLRRLALIQSHRGRTLPGRWDSKPYAAVAKHSCEKQGEGVRFYRKKIEAPVPVTDYQLPSLGMPQKAPSRCGASHAKGWTSLVYKGMNFFWFLVTAAAVDKTPPTVDTYGFKATGEGTGFTLTGPLSDNKLTTNDMFLKLIMGNRNVLEQTLQ